MSDVFTARTNAWRADMQRGETSDGNGPGGCDGCSDAAPCSGCGTPLTDPAHQRLEWARMISDRPGESLFWRTALAADAYFNGGAGGNPSPKSRISKFVSMTQAIVSHYSDITSRQGSFLPPMQIGVSADSEALLRGDDGDPGSPDAEPSKPTPPPKPPVPPPVVPPPTTPGPGGGMDDSKNPQPGMGDPYASGSGVTYCCCVADGITVVIEDVTAKQPATAKGGPISPNDLKPGEPTPKRYVKYGEGGWYWDPEKDEPQHIYAYAFDIKVTFKWTVRDEKSENPDCGISSSESSDQVRQKKGTTPTSKPKNGVDLSTGKITVETEEGIYAGKQEGCKAGEYTATDRVRQELPFKLKQKWSQSSGCPSGGSDSVEVEIDALTPGVAPKFTPPTSKTVHGGGK